MEKNSKLTPMNASVGAGMVYYAADKSFSKDIIPGRQPSGFVAYVDESGKHGLICCLRAARKPWSSDDLFVDLPPNLNGKDNTRLILEAADKQGKKAEAAAYCANYAFDGVKAGEAFLANKEEAEKISRNFSLLRKKLKNVGIKISNLQWSSSEATSMYAWTTLVINGGLHNDYYKKCPIDVLPVMAF